MINLLERMTAFQDAGETVLGLRAGELLEWSSITGQVASFCLNAPAVDALLARRPHAIAVVELDANRPARLESPRQDLGAKCFRQC